MFAFILLFLFPFNLSFSLYLDNILDIVESCFFSSFNPIYQYLPLLGEFCPSTLTVLMDILEIKSTLLPLIIYFLSVLYYSLS